MKRFLTYDFLKEFYLRHNVYGVLGEFNKQCFPEDWEIMRQELEIMIGEESKLSQPQIEETKMESETLVINGIEYVKKNEVAGNIKIVILPRGWVMVGNFERTGSDCKLHNANVIRSWGTSNGLGEIALNGPTSSTKLDRCNGLVEFDYLNVVAQISCEESKWLNKL